MNVRGDTTFEVAKVFTIVDALEGNALFGAHVLVLIIDLHSSFERCLWDFFCGHRGGGCNILAVTWRRQNKRRNM